MDVHDKPSTAGKFNFGFMEKAESETPTPKSKQPAGTYPITESKETPNAKPEHVQGAIKP